MDTTQMVLSKVFSGRYIAMNAVVFTYCGILGSCIYLLHRGTIDWTSFVGVFTPFALTAKDVIASYFGRADRAAEQTIQIQPKPQEIKPL